MTREEIIAMAREAGYQHPNAIGSSETFEYFDLECFASLVAAAEREVCAKVCEDFEHQNWDYMEGARLAAAAIRARGDL